MTNDTIESYYEKILRTSQFVMFSKPHCQDCVLLKSYLDSLPKVSYRVIMVNEECTELENSDYDTFDMIDHIKSKHEINRYPICFNEGSYISMEDVKKLTILSFKQDDIENI